METYEQQVKEQAYLIRWLTEDLNQMKKGDKGKETPEGERICIDLGSSIGEKETKKG